MERYIPVIEDLVRSFLVALRESHSNRSKFDHCFLFTTRSWKNVVRKCGPVTLGEMETVRSFKSKITRERYALMWLILGEIYKNLHQKRIVTQRELYYKVVGFEIVKDPSKIYDTLQDICHMFETQRIELGISCSTKGYVSGCFEWKGKDDWMDGRSFHLVPKTISKNNFMRVSSKYILIIEKEGIFQRLVQSKFYSQFPCILITGCGYPDIATKAFINYCIKEFSLEALIITDYNPHGLNLLTSYKFGSIASSMESRDIAIPNLLWIGLHGSDIAKLEPVGEAFSANDDTTLASLKRRLSVISDTKEFDADLQYMEQKRMKYEIQSIEEKMGFQFLKTYIIQKIIFFQNQGHRRLGKPLT